MLLPPRKRAPKRWHAGNAAGFGLAAVLLILPCLALWAAVTTYWSGAAAKQAIEVSDAFQQARYSIGAEESLERKYRVEPGPSVRQLHQQAAGSLITWLDRARPLRPINAGLIDQVLAQHKVYLSAIQRMFAAIDAGNTALTNTIDETEADPIFAAIETAVEQEAALRRNEAAAHLSDLANVLARVQFATPVALIPGMGLVTLFWFILGGYRRQATEAALREAASARRSEQRFRALVQNASDVILICSAEGGITYHTPAAETDWGCGGDALIGRRLLEVVHPDDAAAFHELWLQALGLPGEDRKTELRVRDAAGGWCHTELILTNLLEVPGVEGFVATARNINARKEFERQLIQQAFYDVLTGLPNRALFQDRLAQVLERASRRQAEVALLFVDLDNFKLVNDSLGHQIGDVLLAEAAKRLQSCVQSEGTVARLGGDEFVILLHQVVGRSEASLLAERVARQFDRPFPLQGRQIVVTASVGVAIGTAGEAAAESLLRDADVAMYRAKIGGKGRHVVFEADMHIDALARLELESDLRQALERGEIRVYYQPIVLLRSGRVVGAEALVRWQHPVRGLVAPDAFIPLAEETGLIVPLGQWVLEQACRQAASWQDGDAPVTISVNLSPRQFQQPDLVEDVSRALREAGLPPACLKLEITEGVAMRDAEATIATLQLLKQLGLEIALDDFGTGYSSLAYLKRLPLDVLKIDRSFVNGAGENQENTAIVKAIILLAHSLNLAITAEGIETVRQALLMQSWGCEFGQGYHWSRPVDAVAFDTILETSRRCAGSLNAALVG